MLPGPGAAPAGLSHTFDPGTLDPGTAAAVGPDPSTLDTLAQVAQNPRVLVTMTIIAFTAPGLVAPGIGSAGASLQVAATNVRLLPCLMKATLERHAEILRAAMAVPVAAPAAAVSFGSAAAGTGGHLASGAGHLAVEAGQRVGRFANDGMASALHDLSEGFGRTLRGTGADGADGLSDSRLMMQIGMLLGFVYVGFLTVWFWATRMRSSGMRS
jgi:hypothetical protein